MKKTALAEIAGVSDAALVKATGWGWKEWLLALDQRSAHLLPHREIARLAAVEFEAGGWWGQMVSVGYERIKGLRIKNQKADGFEVSVTRVIAVAVGALFEEFESGEKLQLRRRQGGKSLRLDGPGGEGVLAVNFYAKGESKTQVVVQHGKLKDSARAEHWRAYWRERLDRLQVKLEA